VSIEIQFICYLVAFVAFILAAAQITARVQWLGVGLSAWVLVPLWNTLEAL